MSTLENIISRGANYVQTIGIADVVDILIVGKGAAAVPGRSMAF